MDSGETLNADYWNAKGCALSKERRFEEALMYFDRALKLDGADAKIWYNKGLCLKALHRYPDALACFSQGRNLDPGDKDIQREIAAEVGIFGHPKTAVVSHQGLSTANGTSKRFPWVGVTIFVLCFGWALWQGNHSHSSEGQIKQTNTALLADPSPSPVATPPAPMPRAQPTSPPHTPVSLPNGTVLVREEGPQGRGRLTVKNGTDHDALVKMVVLAYRSNTYCKVYVQANSEVEINGIREGTYQLYFALGTDWDRQKRVFLQNQSYSKFDDDFAFEESKSEDGDGGVTVHYSTWSVTLHTIPDGNAHKTDVSEQEFNGTD
jgi:tetratricopeptide (TPR) repeat protein